MNSETAPAPTDPIKVSRTFECGWNVREDLVTDFARALQAFEAELAAIEPAYGEVWPLLAARAIRPGVDPGPLRAIPPDDLAKLLDRRTRFDPPRYPAPVGPAGYRASFSANRNRYDLLGISFSASFCRQDGWWSGEGGQVLVDCHPDAPCWRNLATGTAMLDVMIRVFRADWAHAQEVTYGESVPMQEAARFIRPWLRWTRHSVTVPETWRVEYPPPSRTLEHLGGELEIWDDFLTP